jgi:hypothetical protein
MNELRLAVAGGRKTQSIVDECAAAAAERRILILTYTQINQAEVRNRLAGLGPLAARVDVQGWFSFLMAHWVRPYLPALYPTRKLRGLNFEGEPHRFAKDEIRFLDSESRAYKRHLPRFASEVCAECDGAVLDRLSRIYDTIYVDEVQDLNGWDLEIMLALLDSPIAVRLVGDIRQALLSTNPRESKNKQYKGAEIKKWFDKHAAAGRLSVTHECRTWRSNQVIADFADRIFDSSWGFQSTESQNAIETGHDGVFAVAVADAITYLERYQPLCLRSMASSGNAVALPYVNIGIAKGMDVERVLIWPTEGVTKFLANGTALKATPCCSLYVAVTRARHSVAFLAEKPEKLGLPIWTPDDQPGGAAA